MKFYIENYKNINIASTKKKDVQLCRLALEMIFYIDKTLFSNIQATKHIVFGKFKPQNAIAAAFADKKTLILTPDSGISISALIPLLVHECTHIYHYKTNPKEYLNQEKAEKKAFNVELDITKKIGAYLFEKETKKIAINFLKFLKKHKTTTNKSKELLQEQNALMSDHEKILKDYFTSIKNANKNKK